MTTTNTNGDEEVNPLEVLQKELEQMTELAKRTGADFANFRRQVEEEKSQLMAYANLKLLNAIFPAIDNLDRASANLPENLKSDEWVKGVLATEKSLMDALASIGLQTINETGVPMDPYKHEVLMEAPGPKGEILQVFEKGYSFNGQTIRPAKVQVGSDS